MNKDATQRATRSALGGKVLPLAQLVLRTAGVILIVLGLIIWLGRVDALIPAHIVIGLIFVLALWAMAYLAARARVAPGMVAAGLIWGLVIPIVGVLQVNLLPGATHWVIQAVHLLIGMVGIGLGESLGAGIRRLESQG